GLHPLRPAGVVARQLAGERRGRPGHRRELGAQLAQHRLSEPGADVPDVAQAGPPGLAGPAGLAGIAGQAGPPRAGRPARARPARRRGREPTRPARRPWPGFQPPMTTSTVRRSLTLTQSGPRRPGRYGEASRLATTPSRPCWVLADSTSRPPPANHGGVRTC